MERRAKVPPPPAFRSVAGEPNAATSPELLRYIHAAIKRHKPHSSMQSNVVGRASRVLVSPAERSKFSIPSSTITGNKICKKPSRSLAVLESAKLSNLGLDQRKDSAIEVKSQQEDAYLTPPSLTATVTSVLNENTTPTFDTQRGGMEPASDENKNSVTVPSSRLHVNGNANLASQKDDNDADSHLGNREVMGDDRSRGHPQVSGSCLTFIEGDNILERGNKVRHNEDYVNPMTRSSVACSSFATTMSVHSGPTFQSTHAHFPGQTTFGIKDHGVVEERINVLMEGVGLQGHQQAPHLGEHVKSHVAITNERHLLSQLPSTTPLPNVDHDPSQLNRVEKAPRKKKYDPDLFFKVNGKLYQKLGKIGSGGSSEVHKVISSDCTIYALKKIKLKGREYQTAYGFCQEIAYLNRLKGRDNIIQLIDYEVTDKTLLEGVVNGTINTRDGKIKDDHYIYMVLEYGEIDLAHMVSHKWKDMDSSNWKMDENWLRFYWQQMLEAVNTIHEERIVHSDLKPANFLLVRGSLKLIDFGIAKAIMSDTTNIQRDAQVGTLNYMSPEAFMWNEHDSSGNTIKCGRPSDIWSLGCILYQMVYGKTPFSAYKTFWAKFKVITDPNHEISFGPVSNPWLVDLMRRCLAWDRSERWRIPQLLRHPFLVPPIPTDVPRSDGHEFEELLLQRCSGHWSDPEVVRVCAELSTVVAKIEEREKGVGVQC